MSPSNFQKLDRRYRDEVRRRYEAIRPLLQLPPQERTREAFRARAEALKTAVVSPKAGKHSKFRQTASPADLQRWLRDYEASGYDIRALIPTGYRQKDEDVSRLDPAVKDIIRGVLNNCLEQPAHHTFTDIYQRVLHQIFEQNRTRKAAESLALPTRMTVYHSIRAAGAQGILRQARHLELHAEGQGAPRSDPTHRLEQDESDTIQQDLFIARRGITDHPILTFVVDTYSGLIIGTHVGPSKQSNRAIQNKLLHAIFPKGHTRQRHNSSRYKTAYTLPETITVDNGKLL